MKSPNYKGVSFKTFRSAFAGTSSKCSHKKRNPKITPINSRIMQKETLFSISRSTFTTKKPHVTSGVRRNVDEACALLGCYAAYNGNSLPTFRDNLSVPSSKVKKPSKGGPIGCPETSVRNYHCTLHNIPEERGSKKLNNPRYKKCIPRLGGWTAHWGPLLV